MQVPTKTIAECPRSDSTQCVNWTCIWKRKRSNTEQGKLTLCICAGRPGLRSDSSDVTLSGTRTCKVTKKPQKGQKERYRIGQLQRILFLVLGLWLANGNLRIPGLVPIGHLPRRVARRETYQFAIHRTSNKGVARVIKLTLQIVTPFAIGWSGVIALALGITSGAAGSFRYRSGKPSLLTIFIFCNTFRTIAHRPKRKFPT